MSSIISVTVENGSGSGQPPSSGFDGSNLGVRDGFRKHQGKWLITKESVPSYSDYKDSSQSLEDFFSIRDAGGVHLVFGNHTVVGVG